MKKMYILTVMLIFVITAGFVFFSGDELTLNEKLLSSFGIITEPTPETYEQIEIPKEFDDVYENYNLLQLECGFDLKKYKGKTGIRYTYKVLNFPDDTDVFANIICINRKPVGGDIMSPKLDGFMLPLNYLQKSKK